MKAKVPDRLIESEVQINNAFTKYLLWIKSLKKFYEESLTGHDPEATFFSEIAASLLSQIVLFMEETIFKPPKRFLWSLRI